MTECLADEDCSGIHPYSHEDDKLMGIWNVQISLLRQLTDKLSSHSATGILKLDGCKKIGFKFSTMRLLWLKKNILIDLDT